MLLVFVGMNLQQMENYDYLIQRLQEHYEPKYQEDTNKTLICVRIRNHRQDAEDDTYVLFLLVKKAEKDQESLVMERFRKRQRQTKIPESGEHDQYVRVGGTVCLL